jgi:hypothetical protein
MLDDKITKIAAALLHAVVGSVLIVAWLPMVLLLSVVMLPEELLGDSALFLLAALMAAISVWVMRRLLPMRWWLWATIARFLLVWAGFIIYLIEDAGID